MGRPKGSKNKLKFSDETIVEIIKLYVEDRVPIYKLEKQFKTSSTTLKRIFKENNIELRSFRDAKRLYPLNEQYFSEINTKDKAYWLGFMYADGYLSKKKNGQFIFGLSQSKKDSLILFKKYLETDKPIGEYQQHKTSYSENTLMYKLDISSKIIFEDLIKHGCTEKKTFTLMFPNFLEKDLIPHFIRGYFDGDGTVHVGFQKDYLKLYTGFSGMQIFLQGLLNELSFIKDKTKYLYKDKRTKLNYDIKFTSITNSLHLYHYMYKDCGDLFLQRKRDIFESFIKDRGSTTIITNPTNQQFIQYCYLED